MAKQAEKHIHKFRRHRYSSGNVVFFCALPDCKVKIDPALSLGKRTICWRCGEPFILNEYAIRLAKPHCENCHKPKTMITELSDKVIEMSGSDVEQLTGAVVSVTTDSIAEMKARLAGVLKRAADEEDGEI